MLRNRNLLATFSTAITQYLAPYSLKIHSLPETPSIKLRSEKLILKNWWSQSPF